MKKIILFVIASLLLIGCNAKEEKQDIKDKPITDLSIYNLPEKWTNQDGKDIELKELRGKVLDSYTENDLELLEHVFYTLREQDVAGWIRSLQLRDIKLPDGLRDEALLVISERRIPK